MKVGATLSLVAAVLLAVAGAFLVPPDAFLRISVMSTEAVELKERRGELNMKLARVQETRRVEGRKLSDDRSRVEELREAIVELVRQQSEGANIIITGLQPRGTKAENAEMKQQLAEKDFEELGRIHAVQRYQDVAGRIGSAEKDFNAIEEQISSLKEELAIVVERLDDIMRHVNNQHLAMRAVALGALGAFAAALAAFLPGANSGARLQEGRVLLSMVFSGIVALVVLALFATREISVFATAGESSDEIPEHWRVVIVCVIAGAFADRLFSAARKRVYEATRGDDERGRPE